MRTAIMARWVAAIFVALGAGLAHADEPHPYFHAIYCKAVWASLSDSGRARVARSSVAIAAIEKVLGGYVGSGEKTTRDIESDTNDLKVYANFEGNHLKDWRDCVRFYAP
jgi:hypothetical protein